MARAKLFRDPVHNIISFDLEDDVERVLFELIQTRAVQRLRRVRQLGFANLVYHGAEHTRFTHSLGVVHVAKRMFAALEAEFSDEERLEVLCAALLHDIGHGPFSHATEAVTGIDHEEFTARLVRSPETEVHEVLAGVDESLPERVATYFGDRGDFPPEKRILRDLVSSQLDADRLDYILRDGLATGVKIGVYDFERIQEMLGTYVGTAGGGEERTRLAVSERAREAVEDYLIARFHMFKQVYLHRAVRASENMLGAALSRASELMAEGRTFDAPAMKPVSRLLDPEPMSPRAFVEIDDMDIWFALKQWRDDEDPVLARLASGLLDRRLYKTIDVTERDPVEVARLMDEATSLADELGYDPDYAVLKDRARDTPYRPYDPTHDDGGAHIPIVQRDGRVVPIEEISDFIHLLGRDSYDIRRICVPEELREELEG